MNPKLTDFQLKVYYLTTCIPQGYVTTYGRIAKKLNCGSSQAVGQALRANPFAPNVPCHRVIAANSNGGFKGKTTGTLMDEKLELLRIEGVEIFQGKILGPIFEFDSCAVELYRAN